MRCSFDGKYGHGKVIQVGEIEVFLGTKWYYCPNCCIILIDSLFDYMDCGLVMVHTPAISHADEVLKFFLLDH